MVCSEPCTLALWDQLVEMGDLTREEITNG